MNFLQIDLKVDLILQLPRKHGALARSKSSYTDNAEEC